MDHRGKRLGVVLNQLSEGMPDQDQLTTKILERVFREWGCASGDLATVFVVVTRLMDRVAELENKVAGLTDDKAHSIPGPD